jgi:thioesterase domain-containing protein
MVPTYINNSRLVSQFEPSCYVGDVVLFRAVGDQVGKSSKFWHPYVRGAITVHDISCDHMEVIEPQNLRAIGQILQDELRVLDASFALTSAG